MSDEGPAGRQTTREDAMDVAEDSGQWGWAVCLHCGEPLVSTFEFPKKEWWCGGCQKAYEYLHAGTAEETDELVARHEELKALYDAERAERKAKADAER